MSFADNLNIANGQAASGAANSGNPVKVGAAYNTSAPTLTNGEVADAQCDVNGNLKTVIQNGVSSGPAGSPSANVITVQGVTAMTPITVVPGQPTSGGASYSNIIAPATPSATTAKASAGNMTGCTAFNLNATPVYLKFFDSAATVTPGTTSATFQFMIPGNTGGAGFVMTLPGQRSFANAIKYMVTGGISPTDNTVIVANSVIVDVSYN